MENKRPALKDISVTPNPVNGAWVCATIVFGRRISKMYMGYTRPEAISAFRDYVEALSDFD